MPRQPRALTISEVIVAVAICAIAVFALVSLQVASLRWKSKSGMQQRASLLASSLLDESVSKLRIKFTDDVNQPIQPVADEEPFKSSITVTEEAPQLKKVEVVIYWTDRNGEQKYRLVTRVYNG